VHGCFWLLGCVSAGNSAAVHKTLFFYFKAPFNIRESGHFKLLVNILKSCYIDVNQN